MRSSEPCPLVELVEGGWGGAYLKKNKQAGFLARHAHVLKRYPTDFFFSRILEFVENLSQSLEQDYVLSCSHQGVAYHFLSVT